MMTSSRLSERLPKALMDDLRDGERAVSSAMSWAANSTKRNWRSQIKASGLGNRLPGTIRSNVFPKGQPSMSAAGTVFTKAPHIIGAHNNGTMIRSRDGFWLAIPTAAAGRGQGRARLTPGEWEQRHGMRLRYIYRRGRTAMLVADDARLTKRGLARRKGGRRRKDGVLTGAQTVPIFILVPSVKMKKRLNLFQSVQNTADALPARILANWRA